MNRHVQCERCGKTVGRRVELYIKGPYGRRPGPGRPIWWSDQGDVWMYCHDCAQTTKALEALSR